MHITVDSVTEAETILWKTSGVDATVKLANQLLATKMDIAAGRGDPTCLQQTLAGADAAISAYGYNTNPQGAARQSIVSLGTTLELWNRKGQCAIAGGSGPAVGGGTGGGQPEPPGRRPAAHVDNDGRLPWLDLATGGVAFPGAAPLSAAQGWTEGRMDVVPGVARRFDLPHTGQVLAAATAPIVVSGRGMGSSPGARALPNAGMGGRGADGRYLLRGSIGAALAAVLTLRFAFGWSAGRRR